ncbi:carboxypeptidase-like regulatory domain-containing protein [Lysobacter korlensis]|uniref:Carboxypeptidase-like regulatory domain-containing protein n=1 Tax=Lysobacter korlensis TaxID=553636 RepID=A0ABV6RK60_9GAMM
MSRCGWPLRHTLAAGLSVAIAAALGAGPASAASGQPPYRDRVIAPDQLEPLPPDDEAAPQDLEGPPRSLRIEVATSRTERGDERFDEHGIAATAFWESLTLGSFSLDGTLFWSDRERLRGGDAVGGTAALWQRQLHVDGGWRLDNGIGVLNTPALPLVRSQPRFYLPTAPLAGISTDWTRGDLQLLGAWGRAGIHTGSRVLGFDAAEGTVGTLGAQWRWSPCWTGAATALLTDGRIVPNSFGEATLEDGRTRAFHAATAWLGERDGLQLNLLSSSGDRRAAAGGWVDATARRGRYLHSYGVFRLEPELSWGALPINNDVQGGYYRLGYQYGRWLWNVGLDRIGSVSGNGFDGLYSTAFVRHQATSTVGYGGSLSLRHEASLSHSAQTFVDKRTGFGQTRLQLDHANSSSGDSDWQLGVDHAFALRGGARLSASLAYGALSERDGDSGTTTAALSGGREFGDGFSLDGSLRWLSADGVNARRGLDLNTTANWRISPRWSLSTTLYQNRGARRSPFVIDPLVTETPFISLPRERALFLTLRYERQAGRPQGVIGGLPGSATGSIAGVLFLDDNGDGVRAASEQPAVNVTVVLDGRYSIRTDSAGRFEFPRVAVGPHRLDIVSDNLPLPWSFDEASANRVVDVRVREAARVEVGAVRPR